MFRIEKELVRSGSDVVALAIRAVVPTAKRGLREALRNHPWKRRPLTRVTARPIVLWFYLIELLKVAADKAADEAGRPLPVGDFPESWQVLAVLASWRVNEATTERGGDPFAPRPHKPRHNRRRPAVRPKRRWLSAWRANPTIAPRQDAIIEDITRTCDGKKSSTQCRAALGGAFGTAQAAHLAGMPLEDLLFFLLGILVELGIEHVVAEGDLRKVDVALADATREGWRYLLAEHFARSTRGVRETLCLAATESFAIRVEEESKAQRAHGDAGRRAEPERVLAALQATSPDAFDAEVHALGAELEARIFEAARNDATAGANLEPSPWFKGRPQRSDTRDFVDGLVLRCSTAAQSRLRSYDRTIVASAASSALTAQFGTLKSWDGAWPVDKWDIMHGAPGGEYLVRGKEIAAVLKLDAKWSSIGRPKHEGATVVVRGLGASSDSGAQEALVRRVAQVLDVWSIVRPPRGRVMLKRDTIRTCPADGSTNWNGKNDFDAWTFSVNDVKELDRAADSVLSLPRDLRARLLAGASFFRAATEPGLHAAIGYSFLWLALESALGAPVEDTSTSANGTSMPDRDGRTNTGLRVARRAARLLLPGPRFSGTAFFSARQVLSGQFLRLYGVRNRALHEGAKDPPYNHVFFEASKWKVHRVLRGLYIGGVDRGLRTLEEVLAWNEFISPPRDPVP